MKKIILNGDYFSEKEYQQVKDKGKYILKKSSTGIGMTTFFLNYNSNKTTIILSPNTSMIQDKKNTYQDNKDGVKAYFVWSHRESDHLRDFINDRTSTTKILNTTPDTFMIRYEDLKGLDSRIILDEIDSFTESGNYRQKVIECLKTIIKLDDYILTSATINKIGNRVIDIPNPKNHIYFEIIKQNQKRHKVTLLNSPTESHTKKLIEKIIHHQPTNKFLVASNSVKLHQWGLNLSNDDNDQTDVVRLVGKTMDIKLNTSKYKDKSKDINWETTRFCFISSKYYMGYDVKYKNDTTVIIHVKYKSKSSSISPNMIRQIIGRVREVIPRVYLIVDSSIPSVKDDRVKLKYGSYRECIQGFKPTHDYFTFTSGYINELNYWRYESGDYKKYLSKENNIDLDDDYKFIELTDRSKVSSKRFNEQIDLLVDDNTEKELRLSTFHIIENLIYNSNGFSPNLLIQYHIAHTIKKHDLPLIKYNQKNLYLDKFDKLINGLNDDHIKDIWDLLYHGYYRAHINSSDKSFKSKTYQQGGRCHHIKEILEYPPQYTKDLLMTAYPIKEDITIVSEEGSDNREKTKLLYHRSRNRIEIDLGDNLTDDECKELFDKCDYKHEDPKGFDKKTPYKRIEKVYLMLINNGKGNYVFEENQNREYNPFTQIPSRIRYIIHRPLMEIDIVSANPRFVDLIIGSDIGYKVYNNISEIEGCSREQAKRKYNILINDYHGLDMWSPNYDKSKVKQVKSNLKRWGYTIKQIDRLLHKVTHKIYIHMTFMEKKIIEKYKKMLKDKYGIYNTFRFHDAVILKLDPNKPENDFPTKLTFRNKQIKFKIKQFNNKLI